MPAATPKPAGEQPQWKQARQKDFSAEELAHIRRQYCALISLIDDQVGALLAALEKRHMLDETIVIFTSDHGEMLGDQGLFQKQTPYEPALRIPLIVSGPGIVAGKSADALIDMMDLNPTICALAGVDAAPAMDARSFAGILTGQRTTHRREVMSALNHFRCLRRATTKFVDNINDLPELYDLTSDPAETRNLAAENPDLVAEMRQRLERNLLREGD